MAELRWGSATHEGQIRPQNEDNAHTDAYLFVVADGMGGHQAGEVASEMTVDMLAERLAGDGASTLDGLVAAINDANRQVYDGSVNNPDQAGMGTTVTAIAVIADPHDGEVFGVANVGDSRGYVFRHGRLRQITIDHSFVQELVAEGAITRDEARTHPRRNIVTRALGIEPHVRVDSWTFPIVRGDRFVLCSDGLVDEVADRDIADVLLAHPHDPEAAAQALVDTANAAGGRDNITVVVVDVLEGDDPPDPTQEIDIIPLWGDEPFGDGTVETQIISDPPDDDTADQTVGAPVDGAPTDDLTLAVDLEEAALGTGAAAVDGADTTGTTDAIDNAVAPKRGGRFVRFLLGVGVAAVLILGFSIFAAWARSGYYVAFDDQGTVVIYQGRSGGVLWFDPTREATGQFSRDELDPASVRLVDAEPEFESQGSAERFVAERLLAAPTDDDPATTTTTTPTTTTPTTSSTDPPTTTTVSPTTTVP